MKPQFDYATFAPHGIGFVTADEPARPCQSCVFVCRVGAMGGAVLMDLLPAYVVRPDPRPERLNDPTLRKREDAFTEKDERAAVLGGSVMTHSSFRDLFFNLYRRSLGGSSPWIGWGRFNPKVHA
jgi:hypothetical protein